VSYDLEIATHDKPERRDFDDVLPKGATLSGVFGAEGNLILQCGRWSCEIDGPFRCEPDDLGYALARAVVAPAWLIQMHVPVGEAKVARTTAARIATHVARSRLGAVYDPQQDRIIFPRGGKRPAPDRITDPLSRTLKCEWCYVPRVLSGKAREFLSVVGSFLPEVVPARFGTFEPLQHRFEEGEDKFLEMWEGESASSGRCFWKCKHPGLGGGVAWPFENEANARQGGVAAAHLYVELQGDALTTDARWQAAVISFFRAVSSRTEAFYGRAILSPPSPPFVSASEIEDLFVPAAVFRDRWHGIPRHPAWLTWLGQEYSARVAHARGSAPTPSTTSNDLFVQHANLDASSESLPDGVAPALYRVSLNAEPTTSRERLTRDTAFGDAEWLPSRLPTAS
jgi:hypothetical protein